jgi:hypothetical protein
MDVYHDFFICLTPFLSISDILSLNHLLRDDKIEKIVSDRILSTRDFIDDITERNIKQTYPYTNDVLNKDHNTEGYEVSGKYLHSTECLSFIDKNYMSTFLTYQLLNTEGDNITFDLFSWVDFLEYGYALRCTWNKVNNTLSYTSNTNSRLSSNTDMIRLAFNNPPTITHYNGTVETTVKKQISFIDYNQHKKGRIYSCDIGYYIKYNITNEDVEWQYITISKFRIGEKKITINIRYNKMSNYCEDLNNFTSVKYSTIIRSCFLGNVFIKNHNDRNHGIIEHPYI